MAHWRDAVLEAGTPAAPATLILVEAHPGARQEAFPDGFNPWRDGRLGVRVKQAAVDGQANAAILAVVARTLGVASWQVTLQGGATDRRKLLRVGGLAPAAVADVLARHLEGQPS